MSGVFGGWVMVVEYLESTMSTELLCKFPDNSAYDFDYSQSSIWSPLIPRHFSAESSYSPRSDARRRRILKLDDGMSRKLVYNDEHGMGKIKKFSARIKRKFIDAVFDRLQNYQKGKKKKKRVHDFSSVPNSMNKIDDSAKSTPKKGWEKVLKAASKHFKKKNKKKDSLAARIDFSNYA